MGKQDVEKVKERKEKDIEATQFRGVLFEAWSCVNGGWWCG
jgi:hypothetical protein